MDWLKPEVVVATVAIVVSAAISVWALLEAKHGSADAARLAEDAKQAAVRSADASERSAAAAERSATAAELALPTQTAAWSIEYSTGDMWRVQNVGPVTAFRTGIDLVWGGRNAPERTRNAGKPRNEIKPGDWVGLQLTDELLSPNLFVDITWYDSMVDTEEKQWVWNVPPRPR